MNFEGLHKWLYIINHAKKWKKKKKKNDEVSIIKYDKY